MVVIMAEVLVMYLGIIIHGVDLTLSLTQYVTITDFILNQTRQVCSNGATINGLVVAIVPVVDLIIFHVWLQLPSFREDATS